MPTPHHDRLQPNAGNESGNKAHVYCTPKTRQPAGHAHPTHSPPQPHAGLPLATTAFGTTHRWQQVPLQSVHSCRFSIRKTSPHCRHDSRSPRRSSIQSADSACSEAKEVGTQRRRQALLLAVRTVAPAPQAEQLPLRQAA